MIDFNRAISIIRRNGGFKANRKDTSYYRTYSIEGNRPLQARISNHGTWLSTWYDKDYDPSYAINFCVVFSENGECNSNISVDMDIKDKEENVVGQKKSFEVIQYVYNCQLLGINDATLINQAVQSIWQNKGFIDPLANTPKHAKVYKLRPNQTIETIVENKEYKTNTNMAKKQVIKLTEDDLHKIIKESVNKVLSESCWYGDVKPFEVIYQMADKIVSSLEDKINDENYEEWGDDFRYSGMYEWAKRVRDDAEQYMHCNSQFSPINGGEDW